MVIQSFGDSATADLFNGISSAKARAFPGDIVRAALRRLAGLNYATTLADLAAVPGNRLELLKGDMAGLHSIRVNQQWRIVFRWDNGAHEVRLMDYHG